MTHGTCSCAVYCDAPTLIESACCAGVACPCGCHRGRALVVGVKPFRVRKAAFLRDRRRGVEPRRVFRRLRMAATGHS